MTQPTMARPVFSNEDLRLIRNLVAEAVRKGEDTAENRKLANLHHRLGSFAR